MIIKKSEAARILGISSAAMTKKEAQDPRPSYFVIVKGKYRVNTDSEAWKTEVMKKKVNGKNPGKKLVSGGSKKKLKK